MRDEKCDPDNADNPALCQLPVVRCQWSIVRAAPDYIGKRPSGGVGEWVEWEKGDEVRPGLTLPILPLSRSLPQMLNRLGGGNRRNWPRIARIMRMIANTFARIRAIRVIRGQFLRFPAKRLSTPLPLTLLAESGQFL